MPDSSKEKKRKPGEFTKIKQKNKNRQVHFDKVKDALKILETQESHIMWFKGNLLEVKKFIPTTDLSFFIMKRKKGYCLVKEVESSSDGIWYENFVTAAKYYDTGGRGGKSCLLLSVSRIIK